MTECAFCGQDRTLTNEDVWPLWLVDELPTHPQQLRNVRMLGRIDLVTGAASFRERDEGPTSVTSKVKVVCKRECNNGWMSRLEGDVKPVMLPLIYGEQKRLQAKEQQLLSFWAAKTAMMAEYTDDSTRVTTDEQRHYLYTHREKRWLPPGSVVWMGSFEPPDAVLGRGYWHRTRGDGDPARGIVPPPQGNLQQTTFVIGRLLLAHFSYTTFDYKRSPDDPPKGLRQIHPTTKPFPTPVVPAHDLEGVIGAGGLANALVAG